MDIGRYEVTIQPPGFPDLRLIRLWGDELPILGPFLASISACDFATIPVQQRDEHILPKAFVALEDVFGETTIRYDASKGSFWFPLLMSAADPEVHFRYMMIVQDIRGFVRFGFHRVGSEPAANPGLSVPPIDDHFGEKEIHALRLFMISYLQNHAKSLFEERHVPSFFRRVPDAFLLYGVRRGDAFMREFEDQTDYEHALKELNAEYGKASLQRQKAGLRQLLERVEA